jgi:hypothetical protein
VGGDANIDGSVDVVDMGILAKNYGRTGLAHGAGQSWSLGDFNDDGNVDVVDIGILAQNYDTTYSLPPGPVPEPTTALLVLAGLAVGRWRSR